MKSIYTFLVGTDDEAKALEKLMKNHGLTRKDWSRSKVFKVGLKKLRNYTLYTNNVTFNEIVQEMGAEYIYKH